MSDFEEEMNEKNEIEEVMEELEKTENSAWTSVDLYYKGVHIKKSIPANIKIEVLMETIDKYLEAGFKPSWNDKTNGDHKEPPKPLQRPCNHEGCQGTQTFRQGVSKKTGKPWKAWFCDLSEEHADFIK